MKDQAKFEHKDDIVYLITFREVNCSENYIGQSGSPI